MVLPIILKKYESLRHFYNTEKEFVDHLLSGDVTMSVKEVLEVCDTLKESNSGKLSSGHQLGDSVHLAFGSEGTLTHCKVIKVHFTESKVLYDIEVSGSYDEDNGQGCSWSTRLYNVDSCFVTKPQ